MKIDEKTLSILGAPKEGFEWAKVEGTGMCPKPGDAVEYVDGEEMMKYPEHDADPFLKGQFFGACRVRGYLYRQVPIEPEPEVIWVDPCGPYYEHRVTATGEIQQLSLSAKGGNWRSVVSQFSSAMQNLAKDFATQHKELKALKGKLEAWRTFAIAASTHSQVMTCDSCQALYRKAEAMEVSK